MEHLAPRGHDAGGNDVAAIDDGRGAGDQHDPGAGIERASDGLRDGAGIVLAARVAHDASTQRLDPRAQHPGGLPEHRLLRRREPGLDDGRRHRLERPDPDRRLRAEAGEGAIEHRARDRERDHLDGREHLALAHHPRRRQRGDGQRFVHRIEPVDVRRGDEEQAVDRREHVAAPGERRSDPHAAARESLRRGLRGLVLGHVAGVEPRSDHRAASLALQQLDVLGAQHAPLPERPAADPHRVREHGTGRVGDTDPAEPHAAARARRTEVSSATIDAAISAALTAPMSSPTGA